MMISDFRLSVIHGASRMFTRTLLIGIRISRPVCMTLLNMLIISWQSLEQENKTYQSITLRYLPSSAIRLSRLSRLRTNLQGWRSYCPLRPSGLSVFLSSISQWGKSRVTQKLNPSLKGLGHAVFGNFVLFC